MQLSGELLRKGATGPVVDAHPQGQQPDGQVQFLSSPRLRDCCGNLRLQHREKTLESETASHMHGRRAGTRQTGVRIHEKLD